MQRHKSSHCTLHPSGGERSSALWRALGAALPSTRQTRSRHDVHLSAGLLHSSYHHCSGRYRVGNLLLCHLHYSTAAMVQAYNTCICYMLRRAHVMLFMKARLKDGMKGTSHSSLPEPTTKKSRCLLAASRGTAWHDIGTALQKGSTALAWRRGHCRIVGEKEMDSIQQRCTAPASGTAQQIKESHQHLPGHTFHEKCRSGATNDVLQKLADTTTILEKA